MPLNNSERCRRYRQRKKGDRATGLRLRVDLITGDSFVVYSVGDIADAVHAKDKSLPAAAARATIKKWLDAGIIPKPRWDSPVRVYSEGEKDLIVKLYRKHKIKPMTTEGLSLWLAARWITP